MAQSAAQLKNLKPWQPGQSGNPGGSNIPTELRSVRSLTRGEISKTISKYARFIMTELQERMADPKTTVFELSVGSIFLRSIKEGDYQRLSFLLDQTAGKVPVSIEDDEAHQAREELRKLSVNELLTLVKQTFPEEV